MDTDFKQDRCEPRYGCLLLADFVAKL
jgi:hypothetical protein